jgi:type I restriction enzyme S subunit
MPDRRWRDAALGEITTAIKDGTHGTHRRVQNGVPLLSAKNITDHGQIQWNDDDDRITEDDYKSISASFEPQRDDLLLTIVGTLGRRALFDGAMITFQRSVALIRPNEDVAYPRFLFHAVGTPDFIQQLIRRSNATAQAGLYLGELAKTTVPIPPLADQCRIAAMLDAVDEAIAKTEAVIAKLKHVRAGLLHDLLTRGLDEHSQLRDPIAHPEQFQDSPLGLIPKAWEFARLGTCSVFVTSGSRGWASYYSKSGPLFLRISNLTREHIDLRFDDVVRVQPPLGSEGARTMVQAGDILISITADLGIVGVVPHTFEEAYVNQHIALVRPGARIMSRWIGRFLASGPGANQFRSLNDSGAKAGLNLPAVASLMIAVPSPEEQIAASKVLDEIDEEIEGQLRFADKLGRIKSGLMDDLLTGRVRVPERNAVTG